ncbi:MAG TPA: hypothetical protein VNI52_01215 [Sphingobacteriaceae bacterium]|nr:hypothetical protein [Sphingobacteriaceae bacterium]
MKSLKVSVLMPMMAIALFLSSSCANNTTKTDETEVKVMDSVSKDLDKTTSELDDQAKKVETSLEKVDKEFVIAK